MSLGCREKGERNSDRRATLTGTTSISLSAAGTNWTITETQNEMPSNVTDKRSGSVAERASEAEEIRQETAGTWRLSVLSHGIGVSS